MVQFSHQDSDPDPYSQNGSIPIFRIQIWIQLLKWVPFHTGTYPDQQPRVRWCSIRCWSTGTPIGKNIACNLPVHFSYLVPGSSAKKVTSCPKSILGTMLLMFYCAAPSISYGRHGPPIHFIIRWRNNGFFRAQQGYPGRVWLPVAAPAPRDLPHQPSQAALVNSFFFLLFLQCRGVA